MNGFDGFWHFLRTVVWWMFLEMWYFFSFLLYLIWPIFTHFMHLHQSFGWLVHTTLNGQEKSWGDRDEAPVASIGVLASSGFCCLTRQDRRRDRSRRRDDSRRRRSRGRRESPAKRWESRGSQYGSHTLDVYMIYILIIRMISWWKKGLRMLPGLHDKDRDAIAINKSGMNRHTEKWWPFWPCISCTILHMPSQKRGGLLIIK